MIENIAYDMIENLESSQVVDFLRMMEDYKSQCLMEEINKDDLPF
jgi:hypothetical protein